MAACAVSSGFCSSILSLHGERGSTRRDERRRVISTPSRGGGASSRSGTSLTSRPLLRNVTVCEVAVEIGDGHPNEEQVTTLKEVKVGSRIRVKYPLTVYHVGKFPNLNLEGMEGEVKEVIVVYKGKTVSATLPVKVQFFMDVDGKEVKFFAHLRNDEVEVVG